MGACKDPCRKSAEFFGFSGAESQFAQRFSALENGLWLFSAPVKARNVGGCAAFKPPHHPYAERENVKGHKRQMVVDSLGNLHPILVHRANIHDSKGGAVLADIVLRQQKNVKKVLADLGYRGFFEEVVRRIHKRSVEFSSKITEQFVLQPKR